MAIIIRSLIVALFSCYNFFSALSTFAMEQQTKELEKSSRRLWW